MQHFPVSVFIHFQHHIMNMKCEVSCENLRRRERKSKKSMQLVIMFWQRLVNNKNSNNVAQS